MISYGALRKDIPVVVMNSGSFMINIYHLTRIFKHKAKYQLVLTDKNDLHLQQMMKVGNLDLKAYLDDTKYSIYLLLNDALIAGVYVFEDVGDKLNFVYKFSPRHKRDQLQGKYLFDTLSESLAGKYQRVEGNTASCFRDKKYYEKLGFEVKEEEKVLYFSKQL